MSTFENIAVDLKKLRRQNGWSQEDLARKIGVSFATVNRWENGAIRKEVLSTLLRIPLYKDWLLKWNVGSSYPVIKDEDILNLTIPVIKQEIQDQIAEKFRNPLSCKKKVNACSTSPNTP